MKVWNIIITKNWKINILTLNLNYFKVGENKLNLTLNFNEIDNILIIIFKTYHGLIGYRPRPAFGREPVW